MARLLRLPVSTPKVRLLRARSSRWSRASKSRWRRPRGAAIQDARVILKALAENYIKQLKSITPTKVARFGKNFLIEGIKAFATAMAVDWIIGDSYLRTRLGCARCGHSLPEEDDTPEKVRAYTKEAVSFLPPPIALIIAGAIRNIAPLNAIQYG